MRFVKSEPAELSEKKKLNKTVLFLKVSIVFFVLSWMSYGIYSFFNDYSLRTPIVLQMPIVAKHRDILISPVASRSAGTILDLGAVADKIYTLESSGGKNDGCRNLGLFNGYGFMQSTFHWNCYSTHEEVRGLVINWLEEHIAKYGLEQSLCIYNRGVNETGCTYSMNYLSLK